MLTTNYNFLLTQNNVFITKKKMCPGPKLLLRGGGGGAAHILVQEYGDESYAQDGPDKQTALNHSKIICVL